MRLSIVHKLSLSAVLLVLISVGVVVGLFYIKTTDLLVQNALEDISIEVQDAGQLLQEIISTQQDDVLFLVNTPPIQGMLRTRWGESADEKDNSSYGQWLARLGTIFESQIKRKVSYLTIRFIDREGQEVVVVGRSGPNVIHYRDEGLQNKGHRSYVRDTLKLPLGAVYVSEINLNREFGKVTKPHQAVLRTATPVYDERNGELSGVLVIASEMDEKLQAIQQRVQKKSLRQIYITNDKGDYLLHPSTRMTYGFDLGSRYRIQDDIPNLANLFSPDNKASQLTLLPQDTDGQDVVNFTKLSFDSTRPERFIAVTITQDYADIVSEESEVLDNAMVWALFMSIISVVLGVLFSIRLTRPIKQMTQAVDDYANHRSSTVSLPVEQTDEVGALARTFKSMTLQVDESQQNLRELNDKLEKLVSKRTSSLEQSEARQRTIVDALADAVITISEKGLIRSFNPAAETIFGYKADEILGQNVTILLPEGERLDYENYIDNLSQSAPRIINKVRDLSGQRKNGELFPMELKVAPMPGGKHRGFVGILRDITERKRLDKIKAEFISTVSHELRTPLTSIRGSLGLVTGGVLGGEMPQQAKEMLAIASNNTERLLLLINDILDIQKIESGQMAFKFTRMDLVPFLEKALQDNGGYGEQQKVRFVMAKCLKEGRVYADPDRLMQVMSNLLSNAVKFSPEGETIEVSLARHKDALRISVTDHGSGIPDEFRDKIFDKFTQSDASDIRKIGGTGLGLSITKMMVEKHGGHIDFISKEGMGTTFFVDLPELIGDYEAQDSSDPRQLLVDNSPSILIVEDDPDVAAILERMLAEAGYNADIAYDVKQAWIRLNDHANQYRLITLDLMLPDEDGLSFLDKLRLNSNTQDLPVVIVSAKADEARRNLNGGAVDLVDWLQKPIDHPRLIEAVKKAAGPGHKPRVLHVEDDTDIHKVVNGMLQDFCHLTWVTTLVAASDMLATEAFDLVLLDIGLPDGSGLDLLEIIEGTEIPPKVVIFSANDLTHEYADKVSAVLVKSKTDNLKLAEVINRVLYKDVGDAVVGR